MATKRKLDNGQEEVGSLHWIPRSRQFVFDDIVFWKGKKRGDEFCNIASRIDTIVLGPHASAAFPEELRPFICQKLTRRKQYDYSDVITGPVGQAWANCDEGVVFVENPHARIAVDPNREHGHDPEPDLRAFFAKLREMRSGRPGVSFVGVDSVRPITFSGEDVLIEPTLETITDSDAVSWPSLVGALRQCYALGASVYESAVQQVIGLVTDARPGQPLTVIGFHDTNQWKMRNDGALVVERAPSEQLPSFCNFGNQGDFSGNEVPGKMLLGSGPAVREVARCWANAFGVASEQDFMKPKEHAFMEPVSFNRPYPGGYEVCFWAEKLRALGALLFQVEFDRAVLLGPQAAAVLREPGVDWPDVDEAHITNVASKLHTANNVLRGRRTSASTQT